LAIVVDLPDRAARPIIFGVLQIMEEIEAWL
jgi:hypothetical protein